MTSQRVLRGLNSCLVAIGRHVETKPQIHQKMVKYNKLAEISQILSKFVNVLQGAEAEFAPKMTHVCIIHMEEAQILSIKVNINNLSIFNQYKVWKEIQILLPYPVSNQFGLF